MTKQEYKVLESGIYRIAGQSADGAIRQMLGDFTGGSFDMWRLSGPSNTQRRQAVMFALTGNCLPIAKCGVNAIIAAFVVRAGVDAANKCGAEIDHALWCWGNERNITRAELHAEKLAKLEQSLEL